jgi:rhodanese-related sulfurtransferase
MRQDNTSHTFMKRILLPILLLAVFFLTPVNAASTKEWKPITPKDYTAIDWAKGRGIVSFTKAPENYGHLDFLTFVYLPYAEVKFIASTTPKQDMGPGKDPFMDPLVHNWAFSKIMTEAAKRWNPEVKFMWNAPYFNTNIEITDLSLSLKSRDTFGAYITSGSRPDFDMAEARRMLIINNASGTARIAEFDAEQFMTEGDQAVEGFDPAITNKGSNGGTARLYLGVRPGGKEIVIYCSQGATPAEAVEALQLAGVPLQEQMQVDGGDSATCAYNLPGQYFVEPGRSLPHLMGAVPLVYRGYTTTAGLNVRKGPGTKYTAVRKLPLKEQVLVYEKKSGFIRIGEGEWVSESFVKKVQ